jgi:hypothetical protein
MGRIRKLIRAAWRPLPYEARPNAECPECGLGVVVPSNYGGTNLMGHWVVKSTHAELTAACRDHGRPPFNDATVRHFKARD